jgi:hypothetical protein
VVFGVKCLKGFYLARPPFLKESGLLLGPFNFGVCLKRFQVAGHFCHELWDG